MLENKIARAVPPTEVDGTTATKAASQAIYHIFEAMEDGVMFWSDAGTCLTFNSALCNLLDLPSQVVTLGVARDAFLNQVIDRGGTLSKAPNELARLFDGSGPFEFDHTTATGRVICAKVRPLRDGTHIVIYSDVTDIRASLQELEVIRAEVEVAQQRADAILIDERARQREASRMARLDEWLQSCKSLEELYQIVTAFMLLVMPATRGQLFIYSNSRDVLECACSWNLDISQEHVTPDSCWALRRGRVYLYEVEELCFHCDHVTERGVAEGEIEKYLCVPIVAHGDTVGLLHLQFMTGGKNPDVVNTVSFASACGEHISMAIANVKLRDELQDQSSRDPLTGLFNRRYFLEALRRQLVHASSHQTSFALLSLDADKFKLFNDEHGHDAGDQVLEAIAERMLNLDAEGSVACRLGGEEFAILIPNADRTRATTLAEDLRSAVAEMRVKYMGGNLPRVTVSIGIAIYPTHGTEGKDLIKQSDVALYAAKKAGRNCWKLAEGDGLITFE